MGGRPSRASDNQGLVGQLEGVVNGLCPWIRSVAMLLVAMAAPQPKVRNLTSTIVVLDLSGTCA